MNKKIALTLIILLSSSIFISIPHASATNIIVSYFDYAAGDTQLNLNALWRVNASNAYPAHSQEFTTIAAGYLSTVTVEMNKQGSPTAVLACRIYDSDNTTHKPVEPYLTQSTNTLSATSLGATISQFSFEFAAGAQYLNDAHNYIFVIYVVSGTIGGSDLAGIEVDTAGGYGAYSGAAFDWENGAWVASSDAVFYISAETTTPTPTPAPTTVSPEDFWNTGIGAQIFAFIPTLTSLIIVLLAAFLGWKFAGPWGFFAGINVGYVISVVFGILPLWGMIALLVVDGLLLFGKVGFHN